MKSYNCKTAESLSVMDDEMMLLRFEDEMMAEHTLSSPRLLPPSLVSRLG
jgi:hypothetical protein